MTQTTPTPGQPLSEADVSPCTDCDDSGITHQTERACSCAAGDAYRPHAPVSRPGDGVEGGRGETLAAALNELIPAVRAYLMTGGAMSQRIKKNTWEPVLKRAQAALKFEPPKTTATDTEGLIETIRTRLLGVAPDDQDVTLEDSDWLVILGALERCK